MSQTYEFYAERAREAAEEAAAATLENVRERNLRAQKTWGALAEQARKVKTDRVKAEEARATARAEAESTAMTASAAVG